MIRYTDAITDTIDTQEVVVEATVADALPRKLYAGSKTLWVPTEIRVKWLRDRRNGGEWSRWSGEGRVSGPRLRKSGEPSSLTYSESWLRVTHPEFGAFIASTQPVDEPTRGGADASASRLPPPCGCGQRVSHRATPRCD